jgi:hypothetical protein
MRKSKHTSKTHSSPEALPRNLFDCAKPSTTSAASAAERPRLLARREPSLEEISTGIEWPIWGIAPGIEPSAGLRRAAILFEWIERYLVIRLKDNDQEAVAPIRFNTVQQILADYVADCWHRGLPVKCMVPKARQMGISTFWQAVAFAMANLVPGYNAAVVAHDEASAVEIFGKSKTFQRHLQGWPVDLVVDQTARMVWASESALHCGTAKTGGSLFHGFTFQMLHWSEAANYNDRGNDAEAMAAAAKPALAQTALTIEVFESTAKGKDAFYWERCERARDPSSGSEHTLVFLPWFLQKEYAISWPKYREIFTSRQKKDPGERFVPTQDEEKLRASLESVEIEPHEVYFRYRHRLTDEQLTWRRWAIVNICGGKEDLFKRYFPATYEEAFTASASCMFHPKDIDFYRTHSKSPESIGNVVNRKFIPAFQGNVRVWELPDVTHRYVIGADTGGERKEDSDPSCAYVIDKDYCKVVALIYGWPEWDVFADILYEVGLFYNNALLIVENNFNQATAKHLVRRDYPSLYWQRDSVTGAKTNKPGFSTNIKTRPEMLKRLDKAVRTRQFRNPDPGFSGEMETFVWVPKQSNPEEGTYKAVGGNHDDRVIAAAIGLMECNLQEKFESGDAQGPVKKANWQLMLEMLEAENDGREKKPINLAKPLGALSAA